MIFISDVHHQLEFLKLLPKKNEPIVILGDLINWIDYRNGDGIAKEVFGLENVQKLISCLLYTSPSPRDYAASRMPSSA